MTEYGYDPRGNLTQVLENGKVRKSYHYDATNRMVEAVTAEGNRAEYVYNGFLRRVKRLEEMNTQQSTAQPGAAGGVKDPISEMRYILDLTKPYHDLLATEGRENQQFIWGNELLMAEGETSFCYLSDHLGSPIRLTGGGQEEVLDYDEFGVPSVEAGADTVLHNSFGFTGYRNDDVSGLYYAQARNYSPETGRFFSEDTHWNTQNNIYGDNPVQIDKRQDPLGLNIYMYRPDINAIYQSANLYVYGLNNPIMYQDLDGEFVITTTVLLIAGGAALLGTVGGLIGNHIANQKELTGWDKAGYIVGGVVIGGTVGAVAGAVAAPAVVSATGVAGVSVTTAGVSTVATGSTAVGAASRVVEQTLNASERVYYHVTTAENAKEILKTGILKPGEFGRIFVLDHMPTAAEIKILGAQGMETIIQFTSQTNCFIADKTCAVSGALMTDISNLVLRIYNALIVR